jgi:hypothetical protein
VLQGGQLCDAGEAKFFSRPRHLSISSFEQVSSPALPSRVAGFPCREGPRVCVDLATCANMHRRIAGLQAEHPGSQMVLSFRRLRSRFFFSSISLKNRKRRNTAVAAVSPWKNSGSNSTKKRKRNRREFLFNRNWRESFLIETGERLRPMANCKALITAMLLCLSLVRSQGDAVSVAPSSPEQEQEIQMFRAKVSSSGQSSLIVLRSLLLYFCCSISTR